MGKELEGPKPKKEEEELKRKKHTQGDASYIENVCTYSIILYYTAATREEEEEERENGCRIVGLYVHWRDV